MPHLCVRPAAVSVAVGAGLLSAACSPEPVTTVPSAVVDRFTADRSGDFAASRAPVGVGAAGEAEKVDRALPPCAVTDTRSAVGADRGKVADFAWTVTERPDGALLARQVTVYESTDAARSWMTGFPQDGWACDRVITGDGDSVPAGSVAMYDYDDGSARPQLAGDQTEVGAQTWSRQGRAVAGAGYVAVRDGNIVVLTVRTLPGGSVPEGNPLGDPAWTEPMLAQAQTGTQWVLDQFSR